LVNELSSAQFAVFARTAERDEPLCRHIRHQIAIRKSFFQPNLNCFQIDESGKLVWREVPAVDELTKRRLMVASLRYLDIFVKIDGAWLFSERRLYVDWMEERAVS